MAEYEVLEKSYIHGQLVEPGAIVEWDKKKHGNPGSNLKPLRKAAATKQADAPVTDDDDINDNGEEGDA